MLVAFDRVKSEFNGIKPGGAFEQSRRGEGGVCPLLFRVLRPVIFAGAVEVL